VEVVLKHKKQCKEMELHKHQQEAPETPPQPAEAPVMEQGGEVKQDEGLDWGLVFTFFDFRDE
jgi:hypothetical protein